MHKGNFAHVPTRPILAPDVLEKLRRAMVRLGKSRAEVINVALRIGLDRLLKGEVKKPYRTKGRPLGLLRGLSYDNIAELLERGEMDERL